MSSGLWSFARKAEPSRTPRQARGDQSDDNSPRPGDPGFLEKALPTLRLPVDSVFGDGWSGAALCEHEDGRTALEHFMAKLSEESASPLEIDDDQDRSLYHQQRPRKESPSPYQAHDRYGRSSDLPYQLEEEASPSAASFIHRHLSPSPEYIAAVGGGASHGSHTTAGRSTLSVSSSPRQLQDLTAPGSRASPVPFAAAAFGDVSPVGSPHELRQTQKPRAGTESRTDTPSVSGAAAPSATENLHVHVPVASFTAIDPMALLQETDPSPSAEAPARRPSSSSRRAHPTTSPGRTNAAGSRPSSGNRTTSRTPRAGGLATQSLQRPSAAFAKSSTPRTSSAPSNGSRPSSSAGRGPPAASPRVGGRTPPLSSARSTAHRSSEPAPSTNAGGECEGAASPVRPPTARERAKQRAMSTPPPSSRKTQSAAFAKPAEKRTGPKQPTTDSAAGTAGALAPSSAQRQVRNVASPGSASSHWRSARTTSSDQKSRAKSMSNGEVSSPGNDRRGQMWADAALGEQRIPTTLQEELLLDAAVEDTQVARARGDDSRALDTSERLPRHIAERADARPSENGVKRTASPHAEVAVDFDAAALDAEADDIIAQVQRRFQTSPSFKQFATAKAKDLADVIAVCKADDLALASPLMSKNEVPLPDRPSNVTAVEGSRPTTARELFSDSASARSPAAKTSVRSLRSPVVASKTTAASASPVGPRTAGDDSSPECAAERPFKGQLQEALSDDVAAALEDLRIGGASDVVDRHGRARVSGVMTAGLPESAASLRLERMAQRHRTTQDDQPSSVGEPRGVSPTVSTGFEQSGDEGAAPADHSRHGGEGPIVGDGEDAAFAAMMARLDEEVEESTVALMQVAADHFREEEQAARAKSRGLQAMGLPPRQGQKVKTIGGDRSVAVIGAAKKTVIERRKSTLDRSAASFAKTSKTSVHDSSSSAQRRSSNASTSNAGSTSASAGTTAKVRAAVIAGALQPSRERPTVLSHQRSEAIKAATVKKAEPELSEATLAVVRHIQREAAARAKARKAQEAAAAQEAGTEEVAPKAAEHARNDGGIVGTGYEVAADYEEAATTPAPVPAATHRPRASPADLGDDDDLFAPLPLSARPFRQAAIEQHQCAQRQAVPDDNVVNESSVPDVVDDRPDSNRKPGPAVADPADDGMVKESSIPDVSESGKQGNVGANSPTTQEPQLCGEQKPKKYRRKRFVVDPTLPPPPPPPGTPPPTPPKAQVAASPRCGGPPMASAHGDECAVRDQRIPADCSPEINRSVPRSQVPRRGAEKVMATTAILSARCSREAWRESPLDGLAVVPSPMSSEASMEHREVRSSLIKNVRASLSLGPRQGSPLHHVGSPVPHVQSQMMSEDAPTPSVVAAAVLRCDVIEDEDEEEEAVVPCAELLDTARSQPPMDDATSSASMVASTAPPAIPTFTESPQQLRRGSTARSTRGSGAEVTGTSATTLSSVQEGSTPSVMASGCGARVRYDVTSSSIASGLVSTTDGGSVNASSASRDVGRQGVGGVPQGAIPMIDMRPVPSTWEGADDGAEDRVFHGQQFHGHYSAQRPFDEEMYDDGVHDDDIMCEYRHGNPLDLDHGEYRLHDEYSRHVGCHDHRYGAAPCPTLDDAVVGIDEECVLSSGDVSLTLSGIEAVATSSHERERRVSNEGQLKPRLDHSPRLVSPGTDSSLHSKQESKPELSLVRVSVKAASEWLESLRAVVRVRYTNVDDAGLIRTDTAGDYAEQRNLSSGVMGSGVAMRREAYDVARPALPQAPVSAAPPPPPPPTLPTDHAAAAEACVPLREEVKPAGKTCAADRMAERHAARVAARDAMSKRKFEQQQAVLAAKIKETAEAEQHVIDQRKRLDAQRQRRLNKERLVKLNEAREQQRIDALMMVAVSADHIRVLKHCGFLPWRRAVLAARSDRQEILQHGTKRRVFSAWKEETAKSKRHRFAVTVARGVAVCRFVRHAVLNAAFVQWRRLVAQHRKDTAYAKRHRMRTLLRRIQSKSAAKRRSRQDVQSSIAAVTERRWAMRVAWNTWSRRKKAAVEARQRTEVRSKLWAVAQGVLGDL